MWIFLETGYPKALGHDVEALKCAARSLASAARSSSLATGRAKLKIESTGEAKLKIVNWCVLLHVFYTFKTFMFI